MLSGIGLVDQLYGEVIAIIAATCEERKVQFGRHGRYDRGKDSGLLHVLRRTSYGQGVNGDFVRLCIPERSLNGREYVGAIGISA